MSKTYNKLIRDRIPEIIASSGKTCLTATLSDESYIHLLDQKLNEKLAEYQETKSTEELADLLEVIAALASAKGCSWEQLMKMRNQKRDRQGGYEKRILLIEVRDAPAKSKTARKPENAGKPWTPELDQQLCDMFERGISAKELSHHFQRTRGSIAARLVRLGKIKHKSHLK